MLLHSSRTICGMPALQASDVFEAISGDSSGLKPSTILVLMRRCRVCEPERVLETMRVEGLLVQVDGDEAVHHGMSYRDLGVYRPGVLKLSAKAKQLARQMRKASGLCGPPSAVLS